MFTQLAGARTYLVAVAGAAVGLYIAIDDLGTFMGWFDLPAVSAGVLAMLSAAGGAALRAAVTK